MKVWQMIFEHVFLLINVEEFTHTPSERSKKLSFRNVLRYFVNPMSTIENRSVKFEFGEESLVKLSKSLLMEESLYSFLDKMRLFWRKQDSGLSDYTYLVLTVVKNVKSFVMPLNAANQHLTGFMFLNQDVQRKTYRAKVNDTNR